MRVKHDPEAKARVLIKHTIVPVKTVVQSPDTYHQMQNWKYDNQTWKGFFRIPGLQCAGEIWQHYSKFCARIMDVPGDVLNGRHSACFSPDQEKRGWYRIHYAEMPRTVDGAILAVEQTLKEGYARHRTRY